MSLQTDLRDDIANQLFDSTAADRPTETVTYTPATGSTRSIQAFVTRRQPDPLGNATAPTVEVRVLNSNTLGISSSELNAGRDAITVADRSGLTAVSRRVKKLIAHQGAYLDIEVQ